MSNHLTEDQISRWFVGQSTLSEQRHVQACGPCTAELGRFLDTLESFKSVINRRAEKLTAHGSPSLEMVLSGPVDAVEPSVFTSLKRILAGRSRPARTAEGSAPARQFEIGNIWSRNEFRHARWLSLVVHAVVIGLLVIPPAVKSSLQSTETVVTIYRSMPLILNFPRSEQEKNGGGGGGGRKALTPPSKGVPPRGADEQLLPPMVEAKNLMPELVVEPTVIARQLQNFRPLDMQIGDPAGVSGPLSAGPGKGGGIGTGVGTGVGPGRGPGVGDGEDGGIGGGKYTVVGGASAPVLISRVTPEYSDDARKARVQGTVELLVIVLPDGTPRLDKVVNALGYGLDQRAIDAVLKWRFQPGRRDGVAVTTRLSISVNFSLR